MHFPCSSCGFPHTIAPVVVHFPGNDLVCSIGNETASECPLVRYVDADLWCAREQSISISNFFVRDPIIGVVAIRGVTAFA
jgi:hypothetical protein